MDGKGALFQARGAIVVKARLGNDIRRIPIHNNELAFNDLVLMLQRVFRDALQPSDELLLKYTDEDGDLVTLFDESDLVHAKQQVRTLKLTLFVNGRDVRPLDAVMMDDIRRELTQVCSAVSSLLEKLDLVAIRARANPVSSSANAGGVLQPVPSPARRASSEGGASVSGSGSDAQPPSKLNPQRAAGQITASQAASGFDPLTQQRTATTTSGGVGGVAPAAVGVGGADGYPQQQQQQQVSGAYSNTGYYGSGGGGGGGGTAVTAVAAGGGTAAVSYVNVAQAQGMVGQQGGGAGYAQQSQQQQQYHGYAAGSYAGSSAPNNY